MRIAGVKGTATSRVWILFPLNIKQRDQELASLHRRIERESKSGVSKLIRERCERVPANGEPYVLRPHTEPRWYGAGRR